MRTKLTSRAERGRVGLLVSVRSASEAIEALAGGADVIDVKEPARGSLGAADREVISDVVQVVRDHAPVTAAAGELIDHIARHSWSGTSKNYVPSRPGWTGNLPLTGVAFVKFGFAGCDGHTPWRRDWHRQCASLPESTQPVAVAYADWQSARAIAPNDVVQAATEFGCPAVLVDTWDKSAGRLFDHWKRVELAEFIGVVRGNNMLAVIAGSLTLCNLTEAVVAEPDYVAVRGAACEGGRNGAISQSRVAELKSLLHSQSLRTADVIVAS